MIPAYQKLIEKKIKEAQEKGEFDDLPGKGEPLKLEDESRIPDDLRLSYKILKNANCLPPELELRKEIRRMEELLENIPDEKEKYRQIKLVNLKITKLNIMGHSSPLLEEDQVYFKKIIDKLGGKKDSKTPGSKPQK
ncbi:DnaJ family domain-containing protein [Thermodesulfobacteriota bacterium]